MALSGAHWCDTGEPIGALRGPIRTLRGPLGAPSWPLRKGLERRRKVRFVSYKKEGKYKKESNDHLKKLSSYGDPSGPLEGPIDALVVGI